MIEIRGIEEDWWGKRVQFLLSRAAVHQEQRSDVLKHKACAATLLRDAGCLLLLREQTSAGRERLAQAGEQLLQIGLGAGLVLVAMGDAGRGRQELRSYRERVENDRRRAEETKADRPEDWQEPVTLAARSSLGSMLSVVQTDFLPGAGDAGAESESQWRETERRELLERYGAQDVGETGMGVFRYVRVAGLMEAGAHAVADDDTADVVRGVELLGRRREERVEAARRDEFHWRLVPRPAELLDLDSVVLMQVALGAGWDEAALREWTGWKRRDVIGAPLDVAVQLRESGDSGALI